MRKVIMTLLIVMMAIAANAQTGLKKVYNEEINPLEQIDQALAKAKGEGKFVCVSGRRQLVSLVPALCRFHHQRHDHQQGHR